MCDKNIETTYIYRCNNIILIALCIPNILLQPAIKIESLFIQMFREVTCTYAHMIEPVVYKYLYSTLLTEDVTFSLIRFHILK